jgi:hypothetical protein
MIYPHTQYVLVPHVNPSNLKRKLTLKLPCATQCKSMMTRRTTRFHVTCLWCRTRRKRKLTRRIEYGYLSMTKLPTYGYQVDYENKRIYRYIILLPRYLLIDPAGHFTRLRCAVIVALDRLAVKTGLINSHPLANLCEFLANYPIW